jgi:hypothetical protein
LRKQIVQQVFNFFSAKSRRHKEKLAETVANSPNLGNILFVYTFGKISEMKNLSLKMDDAVFKETETITARISKNRNRYINEAVQFYNLLQRRKLLSHQLEKESRIVREESMKVLAQFERLQNED